MSDLRVRSVRLQGCSAGREGNASFLLEDALRCASLPEARLGRLLLVRRLSVELRGARAGHAAAVEAATARARAAAVHGGSQGAASAEAVWFRDIGEALSLLSARLLAGRPCEAWFWSLLAPGAPAPLRSDALATVWACAARAHGAAQVAAAIHYILDIHIFNIKYFLIGVQAPELVLRALGWPTVLPAAPSGQMPPPALPLPTQLALRRAVEAWGPSDPKVVLLLQAAVAARWPSLLGHAAHAAVAAGALAALDAAGSSTTPRAEAAAPDAPASTSQMPARDALAAGDERPQVSAGQRSPTATAEVPLTRHERSAAQAGKAPAPQSVAAAERAEAPEYPSPARSRDAPSSASAASPTPATPAPPPAVDSRTSAAPPEGLDRLRERPDSDAPPLPGPGQDAAPDPAPEPASAPRSSALRARWAAPWGEAQLELTEAAGLMFAIPILRQLGFERKIHADPSLIVGDLGPWVLRRLAERCGAPPEDPLLQALTPAEPMAAALADLAQGWADLAEARIGDALPERGLEWLVRRPAWLALGRGTLDLCFDGDQVELDIRMLGLDLDPGWVPWLGRIITFHYVSREQIHGVH